MTRTIHTFRVYATLGCFALLLLVGFSIEIAYAQNYLFYWENGNFTLVDAGIMNPASGGVPSLYDGTIAYIKSDGNLTLLDFLSSSLLLSSISF